MRSRVLFCVACNGIWACASLHGLSTQFASGGGIIVANHFTRLETFAIPYVLYREAHVLVRVLAAPMFFTNKRVGKYLVSIGGLPTIIPINMRLSRAIFCTAAGG